MNRFLLPLLGALVLLPLSGLLAGCDTAEVDEVDDRPTVAFGTAGVNAPEGTRASIPVTLTGGTGQPVTVEVLFASRIAGTDRAASGSDFTGFGEVRNGLTVATVTFSGAETETQTITFDVAADGVIEAAETASFVLQNAQGARIVTPRELSLTIGIPPISAARARANGDVVTVEGVVTRNAGRYVLIQDETAGVVVFASNTTPFGADAASGAIRVGDRVQLTGQLSEFQSGPTGAPVPGQGLLQINAASIPAGGYQVLSRGNALPAPKVVTLAQIAAPGDTYESQLVCVRNLRVSGTTDVVFTANASYSVNDGTAGLDLRIGNPIETQITGGVASSPVPTGPFAFVGVVGQFRGTNQLSPFPASDIRTSNTCS